MPLNPQGINENAKQDTVFFGVSGTMSTDLSQYATGLTLTGSGYFEVSSSRASIATPREVYVRGILTSGTLSETYITHADPGGTTNTFAIVSSPGGQLTFQQDGQNVSSIDFPWTGTDDVSISVCTRLNPISLFGSEAAISEWTIYNHTSGVFYDPEQFTHFTGSSDATRTLSVNGRFDGTVMQNGLGVAESISAVRVGRRFHPHVEQFNDFVTASRRDPLTSDEIKADTSFEPLRLDVDSGLGDDGEWIGQAQMGAIAYHSIQGGRLTVSPLVNDVFNARPEIDTNYAPSGFNKRAVGTNYEQPLQYLRWVRLPSNINRARVRVNIRSYDSTGGGLEIPVGIRCYSFRSLPFNINGNIQNNNNQNNNIPPFEQYYVEQVLTVDHGTGDDTIGQWLDLGSLKLSRFTDNNFQFQNTTHLVLAIRIDPEETLSEANQDKARVSFRGWQVYPMSDLVISKYNDGVDHIKIGG